MDILYLNACKKQTNNEAFLFDDRTIHLNDSDSAQIKICLLISVFSYFLISTCPYSIPEMQSLLSVP